MERGGERHTETRRDRQRMCVRDLEPVGHARHFARAEAVTAVLLLGQPVTHAYMDESYPPHMNEPCLTYESFVCCIVSSQGPAYVVYMCGMTQ